VTGAATLGRTCRKVSTPSSSGSVTSSAVRSTRFSGCVSTALIGPLNSRQRSSLALTYNSTPTSAVIMYWMTTLLGTGALRTPKSGGR
jgi:hypothetical protein